MTYSENKNPRPQKKRGVRQVVIPENPTSEEKAALISRAHYTVAWHIERSDKSEKQIADKLKAKGYTEEYIEEALQWGRDLGYLDDERYARMFANSRLSVYGANRVKRDLSLKGIHRDIIDDVMSELENDDDQQEQANRLAERKISSVRGEIDQKAKARVMSAIVRKGYSFDTARRALNNALETIEILEDDGEP